MKLTRAFAGDKKTNRRRLFGACLLLVCLWVLSWVAARWLIVSASADHADAIVILSGSSTLMERTQQASKLYAQHRSKKILLTSDNRQGGWSAAEQRNPYFHEIAIAELKRSGVPERDIELVGNTVDSTWDEAVQVAKYCQSHDLHSILLVTSAYHSRRALWTFSTLLPEGTKVGVEPVPTGIQTPGPATWWFSRSGWDLVFVEYIKLIYYRSAALTS